MKSFNTNTIVGLAILAVLFFGLFFLAKGLFTILSYLTPILLILALIIDYTVVVNYGKMILKHLRENIGLGIVILLVTIFAYPFVAAYLAGKAFLTKRLKSYEANFNTEREEEFTPYEDITEEVLDLPPLKEKATTKSTKDSNEYENLFD